MFPRRLAFAAGLLLLAASSAAGQELLKASTHPKFVNPLPIPSIMPPADPGNPNYYEISVTQFQQSLGLIDAQGNPLITTVWGYDGTYPSKTIEARCNVPVDIRWTNDLVDASGDPLPHLLPVDTSLHWAMPENWPACGVPIVAHVHGGHTESASDGLPDQWFTPGFAQKGPDWVHEVFHYENDQEPATIWFHDHALGMTRLNVYAGLAGFYLVRNDWEDGLGLPSGAFEIPLAIQDKMFTADGQLFYPSAPPVPGAPDPSALPEFFGDFILVNGAAWPALDVQPRKYRFRIVNGADSRFFTLRLTGGPTLDGPAIYQIGTDSGLLDSPVMLSQLTIGPGERADIVVDFASFASQTLILRNGARSPYPAGDVVDPQTTGQIMAFKVGPGPVVDDSVLPAVLRPSPMAPLVQTGPTRQLLLYEGEDEYGRIQPLLGTVADGALHWDDPTTENPVLNDVEVWEIYNSTADAHPIHLHLVAFQILDRQKFRAAQDDETGALTRIRKIGAPKPPAANERGWKDTVQMFPGEVTRVIAKFDREGTYVWHCHIISHEDHEMMRRYEVVAPAVARFARGQDVASEGPGFATPSPFAGATLSEAKIFDVSGRLLREIRGTDVQAAVDQWDGRDAAGRALPSGVYFWQIRTPQRTENGKTVIVR